MFCHIKPKMLKNSEENLTIASRMEMKEAKPAEIIETHEDTETNPTENKTPRELWKELGSYSTLHGFHFIHNSEISKLRRALWALLMIVAALFLANQLYNDLKKVAAFQILVQNQNEFRDSLDFPAVSICSNNMMKRSRINGTFAQRYLDMLGEYKSSEWPDLKEGLNYSLNIEEAVLQYGENLTEMLSDEKCKWLGSICKPYQFTPFFDYQYGLCYTFNSGKNKKRILQARGTGNSYGLSILLDAQPEEYYGPYSREGTGFRVIIHDQEEYPSMDKSSLQISPGSSVEMRIRRKELHSLEAPYPKACREGRGYSQSVCLQTCYVNIVLRTCRCKTLGMLHSEPIDFPWCTPWQIINCFYGALTVSSLKNCNCAVQCYRVKYDVQTSSMYFPSRTLWEALLQKNNISSDSQKILKYQAWFRKRFVKLNVFYGELEAEISREVPVYTWTDLANDLGGSMGLFLGCSVLTVFEFIDVLVLMCIAHWKRKRQTTYQMSQDTINHC